MKKYLPNIFIVTIILGWTGFFGVEVPQADAQGLVTTIANSGFESIVEAIGNMVLTFMSFFVYISGLLLDYSLQWTLNIASLVKDISAIELGWKVFRDLCTMFFIFILLYTAISTILGKSSTADAKKVVVSIVIAGLLINFSLFFTKLIIDASNVVSLGFYKALVPEPKKESNLSGGGAGRTGLSAIFMQSLYLQTVYDPKGLTQKGLTNDKLAGSEQTAGGSLFVKKIINIIMGSIVMLVASIVFLAASFFFMVRLVILLLLMVTSPIAFAGQALGGKANTQADRWRAALIDQCLFMPVYLAVTYVGVKIMASPGFQTAINSGNASFSAMAGGGSVAVIFNYCVVIIFLMASLIIAKEFGVWGAQTLNGWAENVALALPRMARSGGSSLAKNSLGRAGAYLDKNAGNTWAGNTVLGRSLRESTYGALAKAKFGGERSFKDEKDRMKENAVKKQQIADNAMIRTGANASAAVASRGVGATPTPTEQIQIDAGAIALQKMSGSDIITQTPEMLTENANKLNDSHLKAIMKSDKITDVDKEKIFAARFKDLDDARKAVPPDTAKLKEAIERLSDTDIENLGYERLKDPVLINELPYSKIKIAIDKKTEGYSVDQKKEFKAAKLAPLLKEIATQNSSGAPSGPNPAVQDKLNELRLGAEDIANLGKDNLVQLAKFGALPLSAMPKISELIGSLSERKEIKKSIADSCTDAALKKYLLTDSPIPRGHTFATNREKSIHNFFDKNPVGMVFDK